MHELYELKELLIKELKEYGAKGELSTGSLDTIDKLAHATKNLCKVIESYEDEEGHSGDYPMMRRPYRGSYRGRSYNRDGYSRGGDLVDELRDLMHDAKDDRTRQEFQRFISKIENM